MLQRILSMNLMVAMVLMLIPDSGTAAENVTLRHARGLTCRDQSVTTARSHPTLAYANAQPPWQLYQELFFSLFSKTRNQVHGLKSTLKRMKELE